MALNLAFIAGQLSLGGAEQQLYYLLAGLDRSRFRPVVISLGPVSDEYWRQPIVDLGISVQYVPKHLGRIGRTQRIAEILRRERVQIVHAWVFHTNPYAAISGMLARTPVRLGSMREDYRGLPNSRFLRWLGYRGIDFLVTNSKHNANEISQLALTKACIRIVPNGVPFIKQVGRVERNKLRVQFGYSDSDLIVGSVGRLDQNKNHAMLLRVFSQLVRKWPNLRLLIIGDGPLKSQLLTLAKSLGIGSKVNLPGHLPRAASLLPVIDVGCLTSHTEGMSNFIMEAASAGIPMVSTRCGDSGEVIEDAVTGYIVSLEDETDLAEHLGYLLDNPDLRVRMGQAAREKMKTTFSIESMITRMTEIYEDGLVSKDFK